MSSIQTPVPDRPDRLKPAIVAIIEDNPEIADLYTMWMRTHGMRIGFVARDGDEAVKAFAAAPEVPDVLIIDHRMPVKSGLDAMREMLAIRPDARFIFISADEGMRAEAMAAGAKAFIAKPASLSVIADVITRVLNAAIE